MGDVLSAPIKEKELDDGENCTLRYGSCCMQGWRKRMEDAHITELSKGEDGRYDIFGVFDGHGGKEVSQFVKKHFTDVFLSHPKIKSKNIKQVIIDTFLRMDELLKENTSIEELKNLAELSRKEDEIQEKKYGGANKNMDFFKQMIGNTDDNRLAYSRGCTACVCIIDNEYKKIYFANAGDSRVVLIKDGVAYRMSIDHKPDLELEKNRIEKAGGWIEAGRIKGNLNLSRGLGDLDYKSNEKLSPKDQIITAFPDVVEESMVKENEFIIIGCDGIWDCLQDQIACNLIKDGLNKEKDKFKVKISDILAEILEKICAKDLCSNAGVGCDNMSCIMIQFK